MEPTDLALAVEVMETLGEQGLLVKVDGGWMMPQPSREFIRNLDEAKFRAEDAPVVQTLKALLSLFEESEHE